MKMNSEIEETLRNEEYIEPETVRHFRGEDTPSLQVLKDMTYNLVTKTAAPYVDFYVFENVVHVLNDIEPDVENLQGTTPEQIWYALERMKRMLGKEPDLSHEVKTYIKFIYRDNGAMFLPSVGFTLDDDPLLPKVIERTEEGSVIEDASQLDNQAIKYMRILEYLNKKDNK